MRRHRVYLIVQTVACCALAALLAASAVAIYRDGSALRATDPMAGVYTAQIVSERLASIAPLFFIALGLLIAGLALGIRDERAEKQVQDAALARDMAVARVNRPSERMRREQDAQRRLGRIGWGAFALCMAPIAVYLANPDHFPLDLEAMLRGMVRVFLPWTVLGLGALGVTSALRQKSVLRETEAAVARMREERAEGLPQAQMPAVQPKRGRFVRTTILVAAVALIIAGILNGSARDVLYKAITICTECVGLG